jgi:hypothetical protein
MSRYHGKKGVVYMSSSAGGNASVITLSEWTLNRATDKVDVSSFGDSNKVYVQGLKDVQGTLSGFWDSADDKLFDAAESVDGAKLYLYMSSDAPGLFFSGLAWLDDSMSVGVNGAVTMNSSFVAAGSWSRA